jgi:hypothetical protein
MPVLRLWGLFICCVITVQSWAQQPDYSQRYNWAHLPGDSTLRALPFVGAQANEDIDVFFIYPTLLVSEKDTRWHYPISDSVHREVVEEKILKYQTSAFAEAGNVYVPFYGQAHIRSYFQLEDKGREALLTAYQDVRAAFLYYLEHYNQGHGIILAGHSQGSTHAMLLLQEFFDGKPLKQQLVAAYLPGIGMQGNEFLSIPLMTQAEQTGGYVVWNTFKRRYDRWRYRLWYEGKISINPITWDLGEVASREKHRGFLFSNDKMYRQSFSTHLVSGGVWITLPRFPYRMMSLGMKNYHVGDINLFWDDIRINVQTRIAAYRRTQIKP